jgi:hypothetical protein
MNVSNAFSRLLVSFGLLIVTAAAGGAEHRKVDVNNGNLCGGSYCSKTRVVTSEILVPCERCDENGEHCVGTTNSCMTASCVETPPRFSGDPNACQGSDCCLYAQTRCCVWPDGQVYNGQSGFTLMCSGTSVCD